MSEVTMPTIELEQYIENVYAMCVELMKRKGYYKYWKALDYDFDNYEAAIKIGMAIVVGNDNYVMTCFEDLFDEYIMDTAGISEEEYYENPEVPIWKNNEWEWNELTQEWDYIDSDE